MRIGVPREIKDGERRVAVTPDGAAALARDGHEVLVERGAGSGVGLADDAYAAAGATLADVDAAWLCDLVVKVKELQRGEYARLRRGASILGFAQLNRDPALLDAVLSAGARVIAYETVRDAAGALPLLAPMSRIAGRLAPLIGSSLLGTDRGGAGVLLPGVDDVPGAEVVILGAGSVGAEAARVAARLGCRVIVFSRGRTRLDALERALAAAGTPIGAFTLSASRARFVDAIARADLVIGAVLEPGRLSPHLITREMVRAMHPGAALVDVGIDQGGIAETSRMTTLSAPSYVDEGVLHYAVPNTPALVARTATLALANAVLPYVRAIAGRGVAPALDADPGLAAGVMTWDGVVVHEGLARDRGYTAHSLAWR
ncbi:MAG TPA: alanine dehydrogenase [Casimicrobiaceae bacterium]